MRVFTNKIVRTQNKKKKKRSLSDDKLNDKMKDMNLQEYKGKGGSAPILLGNENNYLINKKNILQKGKGTKKQPIKLLL